MTNPRPHLASVSALAQSRRGPLRGQRIYLASRFARQEELKSVAAELEGAGAEVVSGWLDSPSPLDATDLAPGGRGEALVTQDLADVRRATMLIAFTEPPVAPQGRGGRHVEFGFALGLGIRLVVVGPREHVFHCYSGVEHFASWIEAREALVTPLGAAEAGA